MSDKTSYHNTARGDFAAGQVVRVFNGVFGDAIVLGFNDDGWMKVGRPYAYASSVGTTGPVALTGVETIMYPPSHFDLIKIVDGSTHRSMQ